MTMRLHYHPFSSYCQKALIALYETGEPFERTVVHLEKDEEREAFYALWPIGKFPVLELADGKRLPESSIIIEHLGAAKPDSGLVPADPTDALQARLWDRVFDHYVNDPMAVIVATHFRPSWDGEAEQARMRLRTAYDLVEAQVSGGAWAVGEAFTLADCAAAPALFYAQVVEPFDRTHPGTFAYLQRLMRRPSFARAIEEARPNRAIFPVPGVTWPEA